MRSYRIQERLADLGLKQSAIYHAAGITKDRWKQIAGFTKKRNRTGRNKAGFPKSEGNWPRVATKQEIECIMQVTGMTREEVEADLGVDTPDEIVGIDF